MTGIASEHENDPNSRRSKFVPFSTPNIPGVWAHISFRDESLASLDKLPDGEYAYMSAGAVIVGQGADQLHGTHQRLAISSLSDGPKILTLSTCQTRLRKAAIRRTTKFDRSSPANTSRATISAGMSFSWQHSVIRGNCR